VYLQGRDKEGGRRKTEEEENGKGGVGVSSTVLGMGEKKPAVEGDEKKQR